MLTENDIFDWLTRTYVQHSDARQRAMGLQYTEAETHDLARGIAELIRNAEWIPWNGGEQPVPDNTMVEILCRYGGKNTGAACAFWWGRVADPASLDIVSYRVIKE